MPSAASLLSEKHSGRPVLVTGAISLIRLINALAPGGEFRSKARVAFIAVAERGSGSAGEPESARQVRTLMTTVHV